MSGLIISYHKIPILEKQDIKQLYKTVLIIIFFSFTLLLTSGEIALSEDTQTLCAGESFVDISKIIPNAIIKMRYATSNNFMGQAFYKTNTCLLRLSTAKLLKQAAAKLSEKNYRIIFWDCYRPLSVQKEMWKVHPVVGEVANPKTGSNHNKGTAIDLSLATSDGKELKMPTDYDDFTRKAWKNAANIEPERKKNRELLQKVMFNFGFRGIRKEWWHFNSPKRNRQPICDIPIIKLMQYL